MARAVMSSDSSEVEACGSRKITEGSFFYVCISSISLRLCRAAPARRGRDCCSEGMRTDLLIQ